MENVIITGRNSLLVIHSLYKIHMTLTLEFLTTMVCNALRENQLSCYHSVAFYLLQEVRRKLLNFYILSFILFHNLFRVNLQLPSFLKLTSSESTQHYFFRASFSCTPVVLFSFSFSAIQGT